MADRAPLRSHGAAYQRLHPTGCPFAHLWLYCRAGGYSIEEVVDGPLPAALPSAGGSSSGSRSPGGVAASAAPARSRLPGIEAMDHLLSMVAGAGAGAGAASQAGAGVGGGAEAAPSSGWGQLLTTSWQVRRAPLSALHGELDGMIGPMSVAYRLRYSYVRPRHSEGCLITELITELSSS